MQNGTFLPRQTGRLARSLAVSCFFLVSSVAAPANAACTGDCDGDGRVVVSELIRGVNIALETQPLSNCMVFDSDGNGRVSIGELIAGVNASLDGCAVEPIFPANYRDDYIEVRGCRLSIEHGGVSIRVFANDVSAGPYLDSANLLPVGSIVVKEEYDGQNCEEDGELVRWRVMRKEEPGFDPEDNDWHWQWVEPDRSVTFDDKSTCISCHRVQECVDRDYMCTHGEALASGQMRMVLERLPGALLSVTGSGPEDVYAVGADSRDGKGPMVVHYDGVTWERLESGASGDLWWINLESIGGVYHLSGSGGLILAFDTASGEFTQYETPGTETIFGIWGRADDDLWAVGGNNDEIETGGVIWHYDGQDWNAVDVSTIREAGIPVLFKVWGRAGDDIYAVGDRGFAVHYDGQGWTEFSTSEVPSERTLFTVHGNDELTVTSGGVFADAVLLEGGPGTNLADVTPAGVGQLNGVFLTAESAGATVGREGAVALRREGAWKAVDSTLDTLLDFHAVWVDPEGGIWAVGGDLTIDLDQGMLAYSGRREISSIFGAALRRPLTASQAAVLAGWTAR